MEINETIGDHDLCAWRVAPGVTWVQTRSPAFAEKLRRRSDSRLVMRGVAGGYLRTFEFHHPMSWAARLIDRYTSRVTVTNEALEGQNASRSRVLTTATV